MVRRVTHKNVNLSLLVMMTMIPPRKVQMKKLILFLALLVSPLASATELIVKFKHEPLAALASTLQPKRLNHKIPLYLIDGNKNEIRNHPDVEYVEENTTISVAPIHNRQEEENWGLSDTKASDLHEMGIKGDSSIIVAVIDTGVDLDHPELKSNIWCNSKEIPNNGKDDDGNGLVDDVNGYDFHNNDNDPNDDHNHGTHVAGIIAGKSVGMAPNVSILPLKFLGSNGSGTLADALKAIDYATQMGVHVMNNSWGGGGFSQAMYDSIKAAAESGIEFVAAAGNDGKNNDRRQSYPAGYDLPNVISVAALTESGNLAYFSNYGEKTVHVAAPGYKIYSAIRDGGYGTYSGTSMAAPHVSGLVALALSLDQTLGRSMKQLVMASSMDSEKLLDKIKADGKVDAEKLTRGLRD